MFIPIELIVLGGVFLLVLVVLAIYQYISPVDPSYTYRSRHRTIYFTKRHK